MWWCWNDKSPFKSQKCFANILTCLFSRTSRKYAEHGGHWGEFEGLMRSECKTSWDANWSFIPAGWPHVRGHQTTSSRTNQYSLLLCQIHQTSRSPQKPVWTTNATLPHFLFAVSFVCALRAWTFLSSLFSSTKAYGWHLKCCWDTASLPVQSGQYDLWIVSHDFTSCLPEQYAPLSWNVLGTFRALAKSHVWRFLSIANTIVEQSLTSCLASLYSNSFACCWQTVRKSKILPLTFLFLSWSKDHAWWSDFTETCDLLCFSQPGFWLAIRLHTALCPPCSPNRRKSGRSGS